MKTFKRITIGMLSASVMMAMVTMPAMAKPGAQVFDAYDETQNGLQVGTDPDIGNVQVNANPGGSDDLIVNVHMQKVAPNCEFSVELVRDSAITNGGLSAIGHSGFTEIIGTLTTNNLGNGNAHFTVPVGDGELDTTVYGHIDVEAYGACTESDETTVDFNEYGAAPDPVLTTPLTWME